MEPTTDRQRTVLHYTKAYSAGDFAGAVEIFTDDVRWIVHGAFDVTGRDRYEEHMHSDIGVGFPDIRVERWFEDGDSVIAEGTVRQRLVDGGELDLRFLDVFQFRGDLVCEKRSYVMVKQ